MYGERPKTGEMATTLRSILMSSVTSLVFIMSVGLNPVFSQSQFFNTISYPTMGILLLSNIFLSINGIQRSYNTKRREEFIFLYDCAVGSFILTIFALTYWFFGLTMIFGIMVVTYIIFGILYFKTHTIILQLRYIRKILKIKNK